MKNRLETQAKPTHFHWIFGFHTVAQHSYASPVVCSKLSVIVCIKCWPLLKKKRHLQICFIKLINKNGGRLIKAMDCCSSGTHDNCNNSAQCIATMDSWYVWETFVKLRSHNPKARILQTVINECNCFIRNSQHQETYEKHNAMLHSLFSNDYLRIHLYPAWFETQRH